MQRLALHDAAFVTLHNNRSKERPRSSGLAAMGNAGGKLAAAIERDDLGELTSFWTGEAGMPPTASTANAASTSILDGTLASDSADVVTKCGRRSRPVPCRVSWAHVHGEAAA